MTRLSTMFLLAALAAPEISRAQTPGVNESATDPSADESEESGAQESSAEEPGAEESSAGASETDAESNGDTNEGAPDASATSNPETTDTNEAAPAPTTSADDPAPSRAPRVATVLVGDPDPTRRARALELDARLERVGLQRLGDPAMRAALLGDAHEDDGLERLHAARRSLLFEDDPTTTLRDLGGRLRVDAIVVVRASEPTRIAVFDVRAAAFYEDEPTLADLDAAAAFVRRAARAAARRASAPSPAATAAAATATREPSGAATTAPDDGHRPARRWLKANWAYLVGGALLIGAITGFVVRGRNRDDDPPPILRFRPGLE